MALELTKAALVGTWRYRVGLQQPLHLLGPRGPTCLGDIYSPSTVSFACAVRFYMLYLIE